MKLIISLLLVLSYVPQTLFSGMLSENDLFLNLQSSVDSVERALTEIKTSESNTQTDVEAIENNIESIFLEINDIQEEQTTLFEQDASLDEQISQLNDNLSQQIYAINEGIASLNQQIDLMQEEFNSELSLLKLQLSILTNINIGDTIRFGNYEQDNNSTNGKEPIEWIVLDIDGCNLMLLSKFVLDSYPYNIKKTYSNWEISSVRVWLNSNFIDSAFSPDEQALLYESYVAAYNNPDYPSVNGNSTYDKVYVLSIAEAKGYLFNNPLLTCSPTKYAINRGVRSTKGQNCCWWLRTTGYTNEFAAYVDEKGTIDQYGTSVDFNNYGIRPVVWLSLPYMSGK